MIVLPLNVYSNRRSIDGAMLYCGYILDEVWRYRFYAAAFSEHPHYFCFVINDLILCPVPSPKIRVGRAIVYLISGFITIPIIESGPKRLYRKGPQFTKGRCLQRLWRASPGRVRSRTLRRRWTQ